MKTDTLKSDTSSLSDLIVVQTVMGKLLLIDSAAAGAMHRVSVI